VEGGQAVEAEREELQGEEDGEQLRRAQHEEQADGAPEEQRVIFAGEDAFAPEVAVGGEQAEAGGEEDHQGEAVGDAARLQQAVTGEERRSWRRSGNTAPGLPGSPDRDADGGERQGGEGTPERGRDGFEQQQDDAAAAKDHLRQQADQVGAAHRPASGVSIARVSPCRVGEALRIASVTGGSCSPRWKAARVASRAGRLGSRKRFGAMPIHTMKMQSGTRARISRGERSTSLRFSSLVSGPQIVSWSILSR